METIQQTATANPVIGSEQLLEHWQGHRRLTRKLIELFPEKEFFTYSIGGMRPFSEMVMEMTDLAGAGIRGAATGNWTPMHELSHATGKIPPTKEEVLQVWDEVTAQINQFWPLISGERFQQVEAAFGMYEDTIWGSILYFIDNEIHHRGQAYVYLRSLAIEPPRFWDRQ